MVDEDGVKTVEVQGGKYDVFVQESADQIEETGNYERADVRIVAHEGIGFSEIAGSRLAQKLERICREPPLNMTDPVWNRFGGAACSVGHIQDGPMEGRAYTVIRMEDSR